MLPVVAAGLARLWASRALPHILAKPTAAGVGVATGQEVIENAVGVDLPFTNASGLIAEIGTGLASTYSKLAPTKEQVIAKEAIMNAARIKANEEDAQQYYKK